jgi:polysaccharide biosynthesis transport protein
MKETDIATDIRTSNIFVVDPAILSLVPVRPAKKQAVLLAGLLGLLIGIAIAFFLDYMDSSIKSPDDIAQYLPGVAFLGFLPKFKAAKDSQSGVELAMHAGPQSIFAENLRSIRTSLFLSAADKPPRSILVTSAQEDEGKSTLSVNLAIAIGQLGYSTVLIDGDLRRPRLHKLFNLDVKKGLSHYLAGEADIQEILLDTPIPKLRIIPCGAVPPNPSELLQSNHMHDLLKRFEKEGVYVIVDSSPVLAVSDPLILGNRVDGAILVVWAGHSNRNAVRLAANLMSDGKIKLCGVVLQRLLRPEMSGVYYHYYHTTYYGQNQEKALIDKT